MKRIIVRFIACLPILFFMQVHAQILYEGMYSSEWEQERDEYLRGIERRRQEQERAIRNLNISIPTQPTQSTQSASTQRNNASRQAAINAKRKAHNLQVQKRNQQLAALNRQRQIEAEKRRREEERLRKEAEQRKREETRQRVTAETYQRLEGQTRSFQNAATYASGEGGVRLREQHDVSRYEKPIQRGTGNALSQIANSPRQKFSYDNNNFVIDPQKEYHLATWGEVSSDDLKFEEPQFIIPTRDSQNQWLSFCDSMPSSRAMVHLSIMRELCDGELPEIYHTPNYTAFLSPDGNTLFVVPQKGQEMFILKLDEPENMEFKNQIYAGANLGKVDAKLPVFDIHKPLENPDYKDTKISVNKAHGSINKNGVSGKLKLDSNMEDIELINKEFQLENYEKKKNDNVMNEKKEKKGIGLGVGVGHEFEFKNMNSMKGTIIRFNPFSDKFATIESVEIKAGQKLNTDLSVNANTKKGIGVNASIGAEGFNMKRSEGYLYVGQKKIYTAKSELEISIGGKLGLKMDSKSMTANTGVIGIGAGVDFKVIPLY